MCAGGGTGVLGPNNGVGGCRLASCMPPAGVGAVDASRILSNTSVGTILCSRRAWKRAYESWGCFWSRMRACSGWVMINAYRSVSVRTRIYTLLHTFIWASTSSSWVGCMPARVVLIASRAATFLGSGRPAGRLAMKASAVLQAERGSAGPG